MFVLLLSFSWYFKTHTRNPANTLQIMLLQRGIVISTILISDFNNIPVIDFVMIVSKFAQALATARNVTDGRRAAIFFIWARAVVRVLQPLSPSTKPAWMKKRENLFSRDVAIFFVYCLFVPHSNDRVNSGARRTFIFQCCSNLKIPMSLFFYTSNLTKCRICVVKHIPCEK